MCSFEAPYVNKIELRRTRQKIVCGTNILSPNFAEWSLWKMPNNLSGYTNIIALGIGWGYYSNEISDKSKTVYRHIFSKKELHSVRDSYTEKKLKQIGINNVVNTGCPTMWALTPEASAAIPHGKAENVIITGGLCENDDAILYRPSSHPYVTAESTGIVHIRTIVIEADRKIAAEAFLFPHEDPSGSV